MALEGVLNERHLLNDVKVESLVNQILLALLGELDLVRVERNERIEVRIELMQVLECLFLSGGRFGTQDAAETLRLFAS